MLKIMKLLPVSIITFGLFIGCATDRVQMFEHPDSAAPGSTIDVVFCDLFVYASPADISIMNMKRDSAHVVVGLPDGYSVESMAYYVDKNFHVKKYIKDSLDEARLEKELKDSLLAYASRKLPMQKNNPLAAVVKNQTVTAHSMANANEDEIELDIKMSSIKQLAGYSSKIDISIPFGRAMDTSFALDSINELLQSIGGDSVDLGKYAGLAERVGVTVIPVIYFAKIKTGSVNSKDTLYYFSKTDAVVAEPDSLDMGDMVYVPFVNGTVKVLSHDGLKQKSVFQIQPAKNGMMNIVLSDNNQSTIRIHSLTGTVLNQFTINGNSRTWDMRDYHGNRVPSGKYIMSIQNGKTSQFRDFSVVR
jgi:hypothetical protein